jgi:hypothetical protein
MPTKSSGEAIVASSSSDVLGEADLGARRVAGADGLDGQAVTEDGVVANALAVSTDRQPPWRSWRARGRSQWYRVAKGSIPASSSASTRRR